MKTFFIWMVAGLSVCMNITAQGGGRRGGGAPNRDFGGNQGAGNQGGARNQAQTISRDYDQVQIADFPEIAGLNVDQKLKLFSIVKDEHKNILMLTDQKRVLQGNINRTDSTKQKEIDKYKKSMAKLDDKIKDVSLKADKKIKSLLPEEQYKAFMEKKEQIKFEDPPILRGGNFGRGNFGNANRSGTPAQGNRSEEE